MHADAHAHENAHARVGEWNTDANFAPAFALVISELQQKLFGQADNGSGVTALHAQLRTVSSELESVKTQQAVAQTEEMTDLRAQLKSVTAELHRTKLQNSEDIRLQDAESRNSEHQRLTHELNLFKSAAEFETTGHSALVAEHELALAAM